MHQLMSYILICCAALHLLFAYEAGDAIRSYLVRLGKTVILSVTTAVALVMFGVTAVNSSTAGINVYLSVLMGLAAMFLVSLKPVWLVHLQRKKAEKMLKFSESLDSLIERKSKVQDQEGVFHVSEHDILNVAVAVFQKESDNVAELEQILSSMAAENEIVGTMEVNISKDGVHVATKKCNIYAVRRGDIDRFPSEIRSRYQIW